MDRDEFIRLLVRLVEDGTITIEEADAILEDEAFPDLGEYGLPFAPEDLPTGEDDYTRNVARTLLVLAIVAVLARRTAAEVQLDSILRGLSRRARELLLDDLQTRLEDHLSNITRRFVGGDLSLRAWQRDFNDTLRAYHYAMARATYGGVNLDPHTASLVEETLRRQQAFMSRYADQVALAAARGTPYSEEYMLRRSRMYSGAVRGLGWRVLEDTTTDDPDLVAIYIAMDDDRTCSECMDAAANGPYLPGEGPMPGEVCLGRDACRCRRLIIRDPAEARRLRGR